ncbi:MAG: TIGR03016 family PEP-CTERM system-associated outer membrane protein [Burkholderiales bacterium]
MAAPRRAWTVVPRVAVNQTFTDNVAAGAGGAQADQITDISPGIRVSGETARVKLFADYSLRNFFHAQDQSRNRSQNALNAFGTLEAIDRWLYIDAGWTIAQQSVSALGAQTTGAGTVNANSTESSNFRFSPYLRGNFGRLADYEFRYTFNKTSNKSASSSDSSSDTISARIVGATAFANLGWALEGNLQSVGYSGGRRSENDLYRARANYAINPALRINASVGYEENDFSTTEKQGRTTHGYGFEWSPTERTKASFFRESRFFGFGHNISVTHRTPLTSWRFTDTRDVTTSTNQSGGATVGTYFDLLYAQLASSIPDPVARTQQVNATLQQAGIAPTAAVTGGFLSSRVTVSRRQELSLILNGRRNTVAYTLFQSDQQAATGGGGLRDDFGAASSIRQSGMSSNFSHRISALTSLNMFSSWQQSQSSAGQSTQSKTATVGLSTRLSPRTSAAVNVRTSRQKGATQFTENAVVGGLNLTF